MNNAVTQQHQAPARTGFMPDPGAPEFMWRDSRGEHHRAGDMATRHLFFTLRMIWNHNMPTDARILPYRPYHFGPFYTPEYMKTAIVALAHELGRRDDLTPEWQEQLDRMARYFSRRVSNPRKGITNGQDATGILLG